MSETLVISNNKYCGQIGLIQHPSMYFRQRTTDEACREKIAKLKPFSDSDTPSGEAFPGKYLNRGSTSDITGSSFWFSGK